MELTKEQLDQIAEITARKMLDEKREVKMMELAIEALFTPTLKKYGEKIKDKFNHSDGWYILRSIEEIATRAVGEKTARATFINGKGEEANYYAERICEALLKE